MSEYMTIQEATKRFKVTQKHIFNLYNSRLINDKVSDSNELLFSAADLERAIVKAVPKTKVVTDEDRQFAAQVMNDFLLGRRGEAPMLPLDVRKKRPRSLASKLATIEHWVYFIQAQPGTPIKIGRASWIDRRLRDIQAMNPEVLTLLGVTRCYESAGDAPPYPSTERWLHQMFSTLALRGEWFKAEESLLKWIADNTVIVMEPVPIVLESIARWKDARRRHEPAL